jgi:hypothetical protein
VAAGLAGQVMRLPDGLQLYRGLGGLTDLPSSFFCRDKQGCRGYAEWAFMSTTADKSVAVHYSGVREGRPKAMVLVITVSAVDRGACVRELSQVLPRPWCACVLRFVTA